MRFSRLQTTATVLGKSGLHFRAVIDDTSSP